ncbi:MAG: sugar kinase [Desulfobacteraceae bacterium]|nr:MAG: sugar kinase [Desulfobacteraceae bacterium]
MLAIVGTVPDLHFPLVAGEAKLQGGTIRVGGRSAPVNRGTPALIASAIRTLEVLGRPNPYVYLAGDIGLGEGSRKIYDLLSRELPKADWSVLVFHYLQPDVDWHNRVLFAAAEMHRRPTLIADAGFMYAAKMSGMAEEYDLFTPDAGELAFLADDQAPHPFYTRGFILHDEQKVPDLITRAYHYKNAARLLLVKGKVDYVAGAQGVIATIDHPAEEALEPIGGTGDTLTGLVAALSEGGEALDQAAIRAAHANRIAGCLAAPTPRTQVGDIIEQIPQAVVQVLESK